MMMGTRQSLAHLREDSLLNVLNIFTIWIVPRMGAVIMTSVVIRSGFVSDK